MSSARSPPRPSACARRSPWRPRRAARGARRPPASPARASAPDTPPPFPKTPKRREGFRSVPGVPARDGGELEEKNGRVLALEDECARLKRRWKTRAVSAATTARRPSAFASRASKAPKRDRLAEKVAGFWRKRVALKAIWKTRSSRSFPAWWSVDALARMRTRRRRLAQRVRARTARRGDGAGRWTIEPLNREIEIHPRTVFVFFFFRARRLFAAVSSPDQERLSVSRRSRSEPASQRGRRNAIGDAVETGWRAFGARVRSRARVSRPRSRRRSRPLLAPAFSGTHRLLPGRPFVDSTTTPNRRVA